MKINLNKFFVVFFMLLSFQNLSLSSEFKKNQEKPNPESTKELFNEMTLSEKRQQLALDSLASYSDDDLLYLLEYVDDKRLLASKNVNFLNLNADAPERYFITGGHILEMSLCSIFAGA